MSFASRWASPPNADRQHGAGLPARVHDSLFRRLARYAAPEDGGGVARAAGGSAEAAPAAPAAPVAAAPRRAAQVRVASIADIPSTFRPLGTGLYRSAHGVWELRAAEDGEGFALVRKEEERVLDFRASTADGDGAAEHAVTASAVGAADAANVSGLRIGQRVAFARGGQMMPAVVEGLSPDGGMVDLGGVGGDPEAKASSPLELVFVIDMDDLQSAVDGAGGDDADAASTMDAEPAAPPCCPLCGHELEGEGDDDASASADGFEPSSSSDSDDDDDASGDASGEAASEGSHTAHRRRAYVDTGDVVTMPDGSEFEVTEIRGKLVVGVDRATGAQRTWPLQALTEMLESGEASLPAREDDFGHGMFPPMARELRDRRERDVQRMRQMLHDPSSPTLRGAGRGAGRGVPARRRAARLQAALTQSDLAYIASAAAQTAGKTRAEVTEPMATAATRFSAALNEALAPWQSSLSAQARETVEAAAGRLALAAFLDLHGHPQHLQSTLAGLSPRDIQSVRATLRRDVTVRAAAKALDARALSAVKRAGG